MQTSKTLSVHDAVATVTAGGIAALQAKMPEDIRSSPVTARAYPHPALPEGKLIVRLEPESIAAGTDAEMAAFGFGEPKVTKAIGQVRSRTLGFPAWALVNEPKKAKAALDVTEEVRKAKRLVSAKPGHAKEAFEKIAKQLSRTAPSFLPSFWEEVGRVVADQASTTMAAQFFEKARSAERAYKLKIDPEDTDAAFIEFALLGALSAKTLSAYAKELVKSAGGKEAYRRYKQIIVKRALGGMPPYSGMGKDLSSLAKAAGVDVLAEEESLVSELIEAPGVGKAPIEFWTTYRDAIIRLGKAKPEFRQRLRGLWPDPRGGNDDAKKVFYGTWVDLLDEVGALADLPDEGLGAWVGKLFKYVGKTPKTEQVLRDLASRLAQLNQPITVVTPQPRWGSDLNLDLCELALELGVPLAPPDSSDDFYAESISVDPVRIAAHDVYGKKLVEAVARFMGDSDNERRMHGKQGFESARRRWIEEQLEELKGTIGTVTDTLETLESKTSAETFVAFPDLYERLTSVELSPTLGLHLRGGLADEFQWPAYEEAFKSLGEGEIRVSGAFPYLTISNATKALALDHTGVVAEHDLVYKPKEHTVEHVFYLDGQFLVDMDPAQGWKHVSYWSSAPKNHFETGVYFRTYGGDTPTQWNPPGGGVTMGEKAFRAGDTEITGTDSFFTDGTSMWKADDGKIHGYDPATGKKTDAAPPEYLTGWTRDGWDFEPGSSVYLKAPDGLTWTPLGMKDGIFGMRVRSRKNRDEDSWEPQPSEIERIDGVRWEGMITPFALCSFPGDDTPRPITTIGADDNPRFKGGDGPGVAIFDPQGRQLCLVNEHLWASRGWGDIVVPPAAFWDYLTYRDPEGSKALRGVTDEMAKTLLAAALADVEASSEESGKRAMTQTEAAVRAALPGITSDALVRGVVGVCERVAEVTQRVKEVATARSKENASADGRAIVGEAAHLRKLSAALLAGKAAKLPDNEADPREWMEGGRLKAVRSLLPFTDDDDRAKVRDSLRALIGTAFCDDLSKMRVLELEAPDDWDNEIDWGTVLIQPEGQAEDGSGGSVFALDPNNDWAIELSHDGQWRIPAVPGAPGKQWKITESKTLSQGVGSEWAEKFLTLPENAYAWQPEFATTVAARADLTIPEATLLALGMPSGWGRDFLGKQKREAVGLKVAEADAARTTFQEVDDKKQEALFGKLVPDDPSVLADPLAFFERLGDAWKSKFGNRIKVPQDLIAAAKKETELGDDLGKFLPAFAGDDDIEWLNPDLRPLPDLGGWDREKEYFDPDKAKAIVTLISWLYIARPVGDPIRAGIPKVVRKIREMLDDPKVIWKLESYYGSDEDDAKTKQRRAALIEAVGGKPVEMAKDDDEECTAARDDGTVIVAQYKSRTYGGFRPGKLAGSAIKKVEQLANLFRDPDDSYGDPLEPLKMATLLRSDGFSAFADRVEETDVPEGGYEANPLVSAKKLVTKVANAHDLSENAAALYLQTLALPEPTEARVKLWNGWKPKEYKDAAAELVKKKLVTEGKRERFGRSIFIKGGYTKGKDKNLPMEEWKLPFFSHLERQLPTEPAHLLFARAYKRVEDGDKP